MAGDPITAHSFNLMARLASTLEHSHYDVQFRSYGTLLYWFAALVFLTEAGTNLFLQTPFSMVFGRLLYLNQVALMVLLLWVYRRHRLLPETAVERQMWSIWTGYMVACVVIGITYKTFMDHSEASLYPSLAVLSGLAFFALGSHYWGWCYLFGVAFFVLLC